MKDYFPTTILILQEPLYNQSIDKLLLTDHTQPCSDVFFWFRSISIKVTISIKICSENEESTEKRWNVASMIVAKCCRNQLNILYK